MVSVSGIYCIENQISGKCYIGSAIDIRHRCREHRSMLRGNYHDNDHLQKSWNRYGENNFCFKVLEIVPDKNDLLKREQWWINVLDVCNDRHGYNICPTAGNMLKMKHSEETRHKISKANKGQKRSEETRLNISEALKGKKHTRERTNKIAAALSKTFHGFISPEGQEVVITNLKKFCRDNNLDSAAMYRLIKGKCKQHKGWAYQRAS